MTVEVRAAGHGGHRAWERGLSVAIGEQIRAVGEAHRAAVGAADPAAVSVPVCARTRLCRILPTGAGAAGIRADRIGERVGGTSTSCTAVEATVRSSSSFKRCSRASWFGQPSKYKISTVTRLSN